MKPILSAISSWLSFRFRSRASLELEIIALRHQLDVLRRKHHYRWRKKVWFCDADRMLWSWLYKLWPKSTKWMVLIEPDSVARWHRQGFGFYWRIRRRYWKAGKRIDPKIKALIEEISIANPLWGILRIHAELRKLGIEVSTESVRKYRHKTGRWPSPGWRAFLRNHMHETVAMDMFIVFTVTYHLLYGLVVLSHDRRKILHFAATGNATDDWLSKQIEAAFSNKPVPRYIVRDRDGCYGKQFCDRLKSMGITEAITAPHAPWQNIFVERVIGSIRRECLDHVIVINERHLSGVLESYKKYYNRSRTHLSLQLDCPDTRPVEPPSAGRVVAIPEVGGLHHRYTRRRAA